jgi:sugar transferase (PEP-CTERM/EpsH1 system associated)
VVLGLDVGGLERVVLRLLERLDRARFAPSVVALERAGALAHELEHLDVPLTVMPRKDRLDPALAFRLARVLREHDARVVHTHNPTPHLYGAVAAGLARPVLRPDAAPRVVHTKHGRNYPTEPRKVGVNRVASALTDRVVAVSEDAREVAVAIERVPAHKVVTILNGVDTDEYRPRGHVDAARARLGVASGGFHVGCVARLSPEKDHATLLAAFAALLRDRPDAHLTLVGDGTERDRLEGLARELGLASAVTFAGMRDDVAEVLDAFDVFALSSLTEGISLTLVEAASAGLPIVATDVGGNAEIVADGDTGLLVRPADPSALAGALARIAATERRAAMGLRGRERMIARFGAAEMTRAYEALYDELLHEGRPERDAARASRSAREPASIASPPRARG